MKKYIEIMKMSWKEILAYRFEVFGQAVVSFFRVLLAFVLWKAIFGIRTEVSGYSFSMMLTYYILVTLLISLEKSNEVSHMLSHEIRNGQYTKYITKPVSSMGNYFSLIFPRVSYVFVFNFLSTIVWIIIFKGYFVLPQNIGICILALIIFLMGLIFLALLNYFFMILSFWIKDVTVFFMLKNHLIEFTAGALIPLSLLPSGIVFMFKYLPFYYIYYYPISLYLNEATKNISTAILVLGLWSALLFIVNIILYDVAKKAYDGVGI